MFEATFKEFLDIDVNEEEPIEENDAKLNLPIKETKKKFIEVQFEYDHKITELQI